MFLPVPILLSRFHTVPACNEYPQRGIAPLATMAQAGKSVRRAVDVVLRVRRHETQKDADLVRARRKSPARVLCRRVVLVDVDARAEVQPGRRRAPAVGFLTTDANAVVKPIHPKAMPVILTTESEIERWMTRRQPRRSSYSGHYRRTF